MDLQANNASDQKDSGKTELPDPQSKGEEMGYGATTKLHRTLHTRHFTMVSLGSSIGMGMWLGSGTSLIDGGPAALLICFCLSSSMVWAVGQSMGEMAVLYPLPSAFVQWTTMFVSKPAGFALGYGYCFSFCITIANEIQGAITVIGFWTDQFPKAAWIIIFWFIIVLINVFAVRVFGEVEVVSATVKFLWMIVVIISFIVVTAGGAPQGDAIGFRYWNSHPFTNGFKGVLSIVPTCTFALAGFENTALVTTEVANPLKAVPAAIKSILPRLAIFYVIGSLMVTITISPRDPDLFGSSGSNASPFVLVYQHAGLPSMAHITNAVILISVISMGSIAAYACSRMLLGLSMLKMAPQIFNRVDKSGRPLVGYLFTFTIGGGLGYLNVSHAGSEVFGWLSNLISLLTLFGWGMICLTNLRMRYVWKLQDRDFYHLPWKSIAYPYAAWYGLFWCVIIILVQLYLSIFPLGEETSARNFFANFISVIVVLFIWAGSQLWYRTPLWIDAATIDIDEHRRFYPRSEDEESGKFTWSEIMKKLFV